MIQRSKAGVVLAVGAAVVTVALTGAAFWLSYEHLHDVAAANGLHSDPARAWAWPATVDLFIIAGELLVLRAALASRVDRWAIALAAIGSTGSIALNIAGVGTHGTPLEYVVAAVPPVAALLAFGALMRQVHDFLRVPDEETEAAADSTPEVHDEAPAPVGEQAAAPTPQVVPEPVWTWQPAPVAVEAQDNNNDNNMAAVALAPAPELAGVPAPEGNNNDNEREDWAAVTEPAPEADDSPGLGEPDADAEDEGDELLAAVRQDFPGKRPSIRQLKETYGIGQPRAQAIQRALAA